MQIDFMKDKAEVFEFSFEGNLKDKKAYKKEKNGEITVERFEIKDEETERELQKKKGKYTSIHVNKLPKTNLQKEIFVDNLSDELKRIYNFVGKKVVLAGLGNENSIVDKLGNAVVSRFNQINTDDSIFRVANGVYSRIDTKDFLSAIIEKTNADVIILVDALICKNEKRLLRTIQISNTGIELNKKNASLNRETLGIPTVSIGIPTAIVNAETNELYCRYDIDDNIEFFTVCLADAISRLK